MSPVKVATMDGGTMPELAPIAEFDKTPPTPPNDEVPLDDLPPPPTAPGQEDEKRR